MHNAKPQVFIDIAYEDLPAKIEEYEAKGWRFVNISGNTVDGGVEFIYSFSNGLPLDNLRFTIDNETEIPSVSDRYPNAFFFENETHDLFGVKFSGISIDFDGEFYTVAVPTPMNPRSAEAREADANDTYGAANYGVCPTPAILSKAKDPEEELKPTVMEASVDTPVILSEAKDPEGDPRTATDVVVVPPDSHAASPSEGGER
jgi:hypothetical protein